MMAVEAAKEKFYCFLGIVHPTYYQSRGWGPWLVAMCPSSVILANVYIGVIIALHCCALVLGALRKWTSKKFALSDLPCIADLNQCSWCLAWLWCFFWFKNILHLFVRQMQSRLSNMGPVQSPPLLMDRQTAVKVTTHKGRHHGQCLFQINLCS